MPAHQRTRSAQRASSLPPSSPPLAFRQANAAREKARRTPIVPSARRKQALETRAETSASRHLQAALALLPNGGPRKAAAPTKLGSPITLRPSKPVGCRMTIKEENEDEDMFVIHAPENFDELRGEFYESLQARAFDWRQDPFEDSPVYVHGQRPNFKHRHKRSSSYAPSPSSSLRPPARTLQPTLLSATPSPHISAANSPVPTPLALSSELDFSLFLSPAGVPQGWPGSNNSNSGSSNFLSTPAFSTPGLSPSASSTSGSPLVPGYSSTVDYFAPQALRTRRTPRTPYPAPY
ncbi:hypothetical protein M408DRAFT_9330 [Serendipita vermifera MAFF 305830]|uniref:Uncharacterized protein n=1 Tax=Serendipita vermifera MAFF 305830 TaxID=933852 RepID=A0A0C3B5A4_SERVB|nr:hypothetical protein M408DRAFT_9330 [Serendipita vermifera MAFF 305830]